MTSILSNSTKIRVRYKLIILTVIVATTITSCNSQKNEEAEEIANMPFDTSAAVISELEADTSAFVSDPSNVESLLKTYASDLNASCPQTYGFGGNILHKVESNGKTILFHISLEPSMEEIFNKALKNSGGIGGSQNQKSNLILGLIQDKSQTNLVNFLIENKCNISYIYSNSNSEEIFQTTISSYDISETFDKLKAQGIEVNPI